MAGGLEDQSRLYRCQREEYFQANPHYRAALNAPLRSSSGSLLLWLAVVQEALYVLDQLPPEREPNELARDYRARVNVHEREQRRALDFLDSDACKHIIELCDERFGYPKYEEFQRLVEEKIWRRPIRKPRRCKYRKHSI